MQAKIDEITLSKATERPRWRLAHEFIWVDSVQTPL
jgi:hypothetical protein